MQHKGQPSGGDGNHRGSIFRLIVGASLIAKSGYAFPTWGAGSIAKSDVTRGEHALECEVSRVIGEMPFLWLAVEDEPSPDSLRGYIERSAIALLSNYRKRPLDPPSRDWLGRHCDREKGQGLRPVEFKSRGRELRPRVPDGTRAARL